MYVVNNALDRIQNILNVEEDNLPLLTELAQIQADTLNEKLGGTGVPISLAFIIVETTIARYRRIGAEGVSNKRVDMIQNKYTEDLFEPFEEIISIYLHKSGNKLSRIVRVI